MHSASAPGPYRMFRHGMNAADTTRSNTELELSQGEKEMYITQLQAQQLSEGLSQLTLLQQQGSAGTSMSTTPLPAVPRPEKYDGDPAKCHGFLLQCKLYINAHPSMVDFVKIIHFMNLLKLCCLSCLVF